MAKYLVTGAAGFIGSSLVRALLERGDEVRGIDNFSTGRRENLTEMLSRIDFREADILDLDAMHNACAGVDYVLHQAAIPSVPKSVLDPLSSNRANVDGTLNVLVAARDAKVKRVVYAASSSEYSGVLAKFSMQMLRGEQPTVFGDGETSRDFTYIDNAVSANLLACSAPAAECAGRVFNCATGRRITLNQTFDALKQLTGYKGSVKYGPERSGDIKHSLADITQAQSIWDTRFW